MYSFDIFDTLVTRRVATPKGISTLVQDVLKSKSDISSFLANNFYKIRTGAENYARYRAIHTENRREVTFEEIYSVIQYNYNLSLEECELIKQIEFYLEKQNLVPITKNIELLKKYYTQGKRVILISDMYYGEEQLKSLLINIDPIFSKIKIYSSSDHKVSKAEGKLYSVVKNLEQVQYQDWQHFGDNYKSDVKMAKRFGIKATHFPSIKLMKYEQDLLNKDNSNKSYQAIIGSAKLARTTKTEEKADKYIFGASFAGPILYSYVDWILKQAISKGFKTLYFVARDGFIPKLIADIIIEKRNLTIKTKYLYGSRLAWRELTEDNYDILIDYMFSEFKNLLTPKFLSHRLGGSAEEMAELLELPSVNSKIHRKQSNKYAEKLKTNTARKRLLEINKDKSTLLENYFKQEIDFTEHNIAFVDLHGSGKTQDVVSLILNKIHPCSLYCFYLSNSLMYQRENSIKLSYITADKKYLHYWVELLCRTTHGQTTGYYEDKGTIKAITEDGNEEKMLNWGYNEYLEGIKAYVNHIIMAEDLNEASYNTLDLFYDYYDYALENLDKETADILGDIPYLLIGSEKDVESAAPKISFCKFLLNFILCRKIQKNMAFLFISFARSNAMIRKFANLLIECPTLQKFLFHIYINKKEKVAYLRILGFKISLKKFL